MKTSSLLGHAAEVLGIIGAGRRPADSVIADFFRERRYLGARDRREISGMVFGVLRHAVYLERLIEAALARHPELTPRPAPEKWPLLLAAYAIIVEGNPGPEMAEGLKSLLSPFLMAGLPEEFPEILKDVQLPAGILESPVSRIATLHSFPEPVIREWMERLGEEEAEALASALNTQAPLSIRVNTLKGTVDQCRTALAAAGVLTEPGVLSPFALVLPKRIALDTVPAYRDGLFEMQDEGSQVISMLVDPPQGATVIDACAGGGGKTLHLAALMQGTGRLVAIDVDDRKLQNLRQRAARAGAVVHQVLSAQRDHEAVARLRGKAHAVLVDAPCSALGTVRRNPALKLAYTADRSSALSASQAALLDSAAELVMPGGRLVYSTCTLIAEENEAVVSRFLDTHTHFALQSVPEILKRWGIAADRTSAFLQLYTHRTGTDGFFAAVFAKVGDERTRPGV